MNRKKLILILPLLVSVALLLNGCSDDRQVAASTPEVVRNVDVTTAQISNTADLLEAIGTLHAANTSQLASQVLGTIIEIRVREGDRVQRGQVLALIDDAQAKAAVERDAAAELAAQQEVVAADSELALADSNLRRYQSLHENGVISPLEYDQVKTRRQAALARRDLARAQQEQATATLVQPRTALEYTRIRAPFDGVITERKLDPGTLASPGLAILAMEDTSHYRLEATVNENDLRYVRLGQVVPVLVDALGNVELKGRVAQIIPAADSASRSFLIKVDLPASREPRSGLFGRAQFSRGEKASLFIPQTAVIQRGQLQGVYVLDENRIAGLRYVTVGRSAGTQVEVLAGIQSGERVVATPRELDLSGKRIEAEP
jgi:membrane fusion protein, multidrug efflux system